MSAVPVTVTTPEDTPFKFVPSSFSFADPDAGSALQSVRFTSLPGRGTLTLDGVAVTVNQVIPVGSLSNLVFTAPPNANGTPYVTIGFQVSNGALFSNTAKLTVNVKPVNDAPKTSNTTVTTPEDTPFKFSSGIFPFGDVDAGNLLRSVRFTSLPGRGTLTLDGVAVTPYQVIPVASLTKLAFTPALNANGTPYVTIGFQVSDGALFSNTAKLTVNVKPVNDAPTTSNTTVTTPEDTPFKFSSGIFPFGDVDAGNLLRSVRFTSLPGRGTLTLDGVAVTPYQVIPVASLIKLAFTPALNANDTPYVTIGFQVSDGTLFSNTAKLTVNVTPVNDVPLAQASSVTTNEDTVRTFAVSDFLFTDVEANRLASITISSLSLASGDTLKVNQGAGLVNVTSGMTITAAQIPTLTYSPAANANGSARSTFDFKVNDAASGTVAATMTMNVTPVNDPPSFGLSGNPLTVVESGVPKAAANFAKNISVGPDNELGQTASFLVTQTGSTGGLTFVTPPSLSPDGTLTFQPVAGSSGSATFSVVLIDNGSGSSPNVNMSTPQTFSVNVVTVESVIANHLQNDTIGIENVFQNITDAERRVLLGLTVDAYLATANEYIANATSPIPANNVSVVRASASAILWSAARNNDTGLLGALNTHPGSNLYSVTLSPSKTKFVTTSQDGTARIFDLRTGAVIATLSGHRSLVIAAAWSPDEKSVFTTGYDKRVRQFSATDGSLIWESEDIGQLGVGCRSHPMGSTFTFGGTNVRQ